jgi:TatD DNase family protein
MGIYIDIHTHHSTTSHPSPQGAGVHPWYAEKETIDEVVLSAAKLIGEIGLDYACDVNRERQEEIFCHQLRLAEQYDKVVVLHCVRAFEPIMKILECYHLRAVIFHGFIGSPEQAQRAIERGYFLSFGDGAFRSPKTLKAMHSVPLSHLFAETDEADISIEEVYARIAVELGIEVEELQAEIENNYNKKFSIK